MLQLTDQSLAPPPYRAFSEVSERLRWLNIRRCDGITVSVRYWHLLDYSYSRRESRFALSFAYGRWIICHGIRLQPVLASIRDERCVWIAERPGITPPEGLPYIEHIQLAGFTRE